MSRRWACGVLLVAALVAPAGAGAATPELPDPIDLGGSRVEVSTDPRDPTRLTAGLWADTLTGPGGVDGNLHRFKYQRTMENSTVLVGVVATSPEESGDAVEVSVKSGSTSCGTDSSTSGVPGSAYGALVVSETFDTADDPCVDSNSLDIAVGRGTATFTGDLPIAIRIVEEAPIVDAEKDLPPPVETPDVPLPQPVEPSPVTGGSSFDEAPELEPGSTVSDAVPEGTERLYRVRLDWGQALAARVDVPPTDAIEGVSPTVNLTLVDPLRNTFDGGAEERDEEGAYDDDGSSLFDGTRPVTYLNRFDDGLMIVPGDYWVSVAVAPATDREPVDVPVEISVDVVGEPGKAPTFREVVTAPGGKAGPGGYDSTTPYLIGENQFSADISGTPRVPEADEQGGSETRALVGIALAIVSACLCLAGVASLRRRSRQ